MKSGLFRQICEDVWKSFNILLSEVSMIFETLDKNSEVKNDDYQEIKRNKLEVRFRLNTLSCRRTVLISGDMLVIKDEGEDAV